MFVWFVRQEACFVSLLSILSIEMALFSVFLEMGDQDYKSFLSTFKGNSRESSEHCG